MLVRTEQVQAVFFTRTCNQQLMSTTLSEAGQSLNAPQHIGLGFACNVENSVYSPVTSKLCNLVVFINAENYLCGNLLLKCWIVN